MTDKFIYLLMILGAIFGQGHLLPGNLQYRSFRRLP